MSLERKDIRAKLDPDIHEGLIAVCEADDIDISTFIEREIERIVIKRVHDAQIIASRIRGSGTLGKLASRLGKNQE